MGLRLRSRRAEATACGTCTRACPMHMCMPCAHLSCDRQAATRALYPIPSSPAENPFICRSFVPRESPAAAHDTTHNSCHHVRAVKCIIL